MHLIGEIVTSGFQGCTGFQDLTMTSPLTHFVNRLREAKVLLDPYPHFCLDNIFPDDYYRTLLRNLPASASYDNLYEVTTLKLDHFRHRDQRDMNAGWTNELPRSRKSFGTISTRGFSAKTWLRPCSKHFPIKCTRDSEHNGRR